MKLKFKLFAYVCAIAMTFNITGYCSEPKSEELDITAPCAILVDQTSGKVLYEKNSTQPTYTASLMKIMNLIIAFQEIEDGNLKLTENINVSSEAEIHTGSNIWLKSGETVTVEDLIKAISMISADDASLALALRISKEKGKFISLMNEFAKNLHLENTIFKNCIGKDEDGNISSAKDISLMALKLLEYEEAMPYFSTWIDHIRNEKTQIVNTNRIIKSYPGATGIKTGTSKEAGSCICASAEKNGFKLVCVILGCENPDTRTKETKKLLDYGFSEFSLVTPTLPQDLPSTIKVKNGMNSSVEITALTAETFPVNRKNHEKIHSETILNCDALEAPVSSGTKIGEILYKQGQELKCVCDIVTKSSVPKISFTDVFKALTVNLFRL